MKSINYLVSIVAVVALLIALLASVSAAVNIESVEVSGIETEPAGSVNVAAFAGQTIPVRILFEATGNNESDVVVKAWISGERDYRVTTKRFAALASGTYSALLNVQVPSNIDPAEKLRLQILIESESSGRLDSREISIAAQRESYQLEILDVIFDPKVQAGETLAVDVILSNDGYEFADDSFVKIRVPALGIERRAYFGDLSPVDQPVRAESPDRLDKEDTTERRIYLPVPASAPAGVYAIEIEAYNEDASILVSKKLAVMASSDASIVVSPSKSKTFNVGSQGTYSVTLVNSGQNVRVYELVTEASADLNVEAEETIVAIPAGTSKTVKVMASSSKAGEYPFSVSVYSDGNLVKKESFTANVEGRTRTGAGTGRTTTPNTTVVLTVVLAIIFVVLLVVIIVLLTRKPKKAEEFGESYY